MAQGALYCLADTTDRSQISVFYEIRAFRDRMVGRMAYALAPTTGIFIVLFGHTTCGSRLVRSAP
jgi:hypothetical protein